MCDVVTEHESEDGTRGSLVVEAKALGKLLGAKDTDSRYYMEVPEVAACGEGASLLYLIDERCRQKGLAQLGTHPSHVGLLTWQELGAIHIELALCLDASAPLRAFVAGAIQ